ncbi:cytochrome P450 [Lentinus tigrinus ALCF2SS1-7]|uniref:Cytochrome P450 n=1 Tax=Lentinus tigrinus ALCF2SS1-6 TaxID=1328759 RepID=A0A5C2RMY0_9APHY|nr:cytochrome P450 [Lentinus tigrinus ALCF2SS1-6]RPD79480.1 cytochrome P450 [Lentinus tigrinus ALCF2SS1-7]
MALSDPVPLLLLAAVLAAAIAWLVSRPSDRRYAPGPAPKPVLGNILAMPAQGDIPAFERCRERYGDLVYFHGLGYKVLVINTMKAITDLFEKRHSNYSDRPAFTVVGELMRLGQSTPLLSYNDEWRIHRKLAHSALGPNAIRQYYHIQEDLAALLSQQFLEAPEKFVDHVRLAAARVVLSITYGLSVDKADDEYVTQAEDTMRMISKATVPGAFLADVFPFLKYLPSWVPFQRHARHGREMIETLVTKPFEYVKEQMRAGVAPPSLAHHLLSEYDKGDIDHQIKWATGSLYGAGGETSYATTLTFMMAMALHPEKQRLAQEEIDRVIGSERLPTINDRSQLPYVNAVIKETMRWNPAVPMGLARMVSEDDVYEGYLIPKGTIVLPNCWAVAHERRGPYEPSEFVPERWLTGEGDDAPVDPAMWAFGFGRRLCPGKPLAENSVFIFISTLLSVFDISLPDEGKLEPKFTQGLISYPLPFNCKITPRSASKVAQVSYRAAHCTV